MASRTPLVSAEQFNLNSDIYKVYQKIVDDTVQRASAKHNPKVLQELKVRWLAHLQQHISLNSQQPQPATPDLCQPSNVPDLVSFFSGSDKKASVFQVPNLKTIGTPKSKAVPPRLEKKGPGSMRSQPAMACVVDAPSSVPPPAKKFAMNLNNTPSPSVAEPEEDWGDWDEWEATEQKTDKSMVERLAQASMVREGYSPDDDSSLGGVSDLDDDEPPFQDMAIATFEAVHRPHSKKAHQRGKWRLHLKHGVLRIENHEVPFNSLVGELDF
ncbi:MAG: hypothetical protein KVP17_002863 [Porospora cf. gigantea B]|uniref:uncharacterized protein n=1 Tax=Porospora cf. gigantea B TaxID=2853592 RepID=UPI003571F52F|nr:MAG: hypothetical protein KVP17_002863 [Porospora cf. gigantea B]